MPRTDELPAAGHVSRLGVLLQLHRRRALISQEGLAERSQVSVRTIRELERGRVRVPRAQSVRLLAAALGLNGDALDQFEAAARDQDDVSGQDMAPKQLPAAVTDLTGRDDQAAALRAMFEGRDELTVVVLTGPPGVGKSALAVHVAHQLRPTFADGQLYVRLHDGEGRPIQAREVLARFLRVLGVVGQHIPTGEAERSAMFRSRLADRRMLVVLDDAVDLGQVRPLLPATRGCGVLVTSRARLTDLEGSRSVDVNLLEPVQAVTLLGRIAGPNRVRDDPAAADAIARRCGCLPLALRVAGARLAARPHWPLARLDDLLADEHRRLDELAAADLEVRAGLELSYGALGPLPRTAFQLLGLLGATDVCAWAVAALLDLPLDQAEQAVEELVDARLLDVDQEPAAGPIRYGFHDLIRLYALERAEAELDDRIRREALSRALGAWLAVVEKADARLPATSDVITRGRAARYPLPDELAAVLVEDPLGWFESERANLMVAVERACELGAAELAWELTASLLSWAALRSHWDLWRHTHELALAVCRRADDRRGEAAMMAGLGRLASDQREAGLGLPELGAALATFSDLGDRHAEARLLVVRALTLLMAGRGEEGLRSATAGARLATTMGSPGIEADALFCLAQAHLDLDRREDAAATARMAATTYRRLGKPLGEAQALCQLATLHRRAGELQEATDLLERCRNMVEGIGDRRGQARILLDLGAVALERGDEAEATANLTACLHVCREIGETHFHAEAVDILRLIDQPAGGTW